VSDPAPLRQTTAQDAFLDGRVMIEQPLEGYRAAMDPVLLAAAVPAVNDRGRMPGGPVLDLGCGVGTVALCYAWRVPHAKVVGLERDAATAALARANATANGLEGRVEILTGDLLAPPPDLKPGHFAQVMANPPFHEAVGAVASPHAGRDVANREGEAKLSDWIDAMLRAAVPKGGITLIHRADRLSEVLSALSGRAGDIRILPLWPRAGVPAKRVIIHARKGVRSPDRLLPGLVLHGPGADEEKGQRYTLPAQSILRDGMALPLFDEASTFKSGR